MRAMKDSGIEWIGEIPENWELRKIKNSFFIIAGATPKSGEASYWDGEIPWITPADYATDDVFVSFGRKYITQEGLNSCATSLIPEGSIIFSKRAPVGLVAISRNPLCTNQGCLACIPQKGIDIKYHYYVMSVFNEQFDLLASGTTFKEISADTFANFKLPHPNYEMQKKIAFYLDSKCAEIDALIAAKEKSNKLLKEHRQSIIYEAVTKGLDPNAKMKDSGIEWIGEIPEGWSVERLKYHIDFNPATNVPEYSDTDTVSFLPMECLKNGTHLINEMEYQKVQKGYVIFQEGDILMAKVTPCLENGNLAIAHGLNDGVGFGSTEINVIRCKDINREYLFYILQTPTFIDKAVSNMYGVAGLKRLNPDFIPNTFYPIPPIDVQKLIVNYLNEECYKIDSIIKSNESTIEKLKEYRQSVIYEAVTGKTEI